jgi:hypothetical protein
MYIRMSAGVCACAFVHVYGCMCVNVRVWIHVCVSVCVRVFEFVNVCNVFVYVFVHVILLHMYW